MPNVLVPTAQSLQVASSSSSVRQNDRSRNRQRLLVGTYDSKAKIKARGERDAANAKLWRI